MFDNKLDCGSTLDIAFVRGQSIRWLLTTKKEHNSVAIDLNSQVKNNITNCNNYVILFTPISSASFATDCSFIRVNIQTYQRNYGIKRTVGKVSKKERGEEIELTQQPQRYSGGRLMNLHHNVSYLVSETLDLKENINLRPCY